MQETTPFIESQKLLRCLVVNRYQETSVRFIEFEAFKLWEHLMNTKHGLKVTDPKLCLWVGEDEFVSHASVFERAGEIETVNRVLVDLFDPDYGFSQTITRYVRSNETAQIVDILRSHMPRDLNDSDACSIEIIEGRVVQQSSYHPERGMLMGLRG
jgi:hypothetical protein